jgi:hypothetical protein
MTPGLGAARPARRYGTSRLAAAATPSQGHARSSTAPARAQAAGGDVHAGNAAPTGGHRGAENLISRLVTWSPGR